MELAADLDAAGLGKHAARILALARPSLLLAPKRCAQNVLARGASRLGGVPDLPPHFEWPSYGGRPHAFLAQFQLDALPASLLPRTGTLAFFYEVEAMTWGNERADSGSAQVAYFDTPLDSLVPRQPPGEIFAPCALSFEETVDLPEHGDLIVEDRLDDLDDDEQEAYSELAASLHEDLYHHLLGHPQLIQNDLRVECEQASSSHPSSPEGYKAARPRGHEWELLLQLDTDDAGPGWMWGDSGRIYFCIRNVDLAAHRFDRTWLILQCY